MTVTNMIKDMKRDEEFQLKGQKDRERHSKRWRGQGEEKKTFLFYHFLLRTEYHMS